MGEDADPELLDLMRKHYMGDDPKKDLTETDVLASAGHIYNNSVDVACDMKSTKRAAELIYLQMANKGYSPATWNSHFLHPTLQDLGGSEEELVKFVFTMDLLNFCFWSGREDGTRWEVEYGEEWLGEGQIKWNGYWALVAALRRAKEEGWPITDPSFWIELESDDEEEEEEEEEEQDESAQDPDDALKKLEGNGQAEEEQSKPDGEDKKPEDSEDKKPETNGHAEEDHKNGEAAPEGENNQEDQDGQPDEDTVVSPGADLARQKSLKKARQSRQSMLFASSRPRRGPLTLSMLKHIFRSCTDEPLPLIKRRFQILQEAGEILYEKFDGSPVNLIKEAKGSAAVLVNLLAEHFPCFRDETKYEGRKVRFLKRAQILVADLWAAFQGESYGSFSDIGKITMFADYRVPQILHTLGCLQYCPPLESKIRKGEELEAGCDSEVQLRGCSIWSVEMIRQEIMKNHPEAEVNAVLIDFFLYDSMKELEKDDEVPIPHHKTKSIWY